MSHKHVNYDQVAPNYDRRFKAGEWSGTAAALLALAQKVGAERILEVGCGTGRWLADLQPVTRQLYGLDFSGGMLAQAQRRDGQLHLTRGRGGRLPFAAATFDLLYCVNAIHHFDGQRDFVFEARRLLRPGGALAVVGMDPHTGHDQYYPYHYFESAFEWMAAAGFAQVEWRVVERILNHKAGRAVLDDPFLHKDATSQLALLADEVYAAGLRRIEAALEAAEAAGEQLIFPVDISMGMLTAWIHRPGKP
jgi:ubiquinone/menaquinone biosynthesis C-methylase UbiE